jgi:hypothetical protein
MQGWHDQELLSGVAVHPAIFSAASRFWLLIDVHVLRR